PSRLLPCESVLFMFIVRPHVRGHVFLCILGYYMEWHLKRELAPLLFIDEHKDKGKAKRTTPVGKAQISDSAIKK
ncbi:MAG: hypothetical protein OXC03_06445, partial [Flavobacteriaceae bacterium]|nr:hypothetical protein [Flavobacteriaceae bacterium]